MSQEVTVTRQSAMSGNDNDNGPFQSLSKTLMAYTHWDMLLEMTVTRQSPMSGNENGINTHKVVTISLSILLLILTLSVIFTLFFFFSH